MLKFWLQTHKWIALVVGVQVLFWVAGGLVMTAIPIGIVRSENHIAVQEPEGFKLDEIIPLAELSTKASLPPVGGAELKRTPHGPIWVIKTTIGGESYYDARTGADVEEITEAEARTAAAQAYVGAGHPVTAAYLDEAPEEADVAAPLFRVDFDDREHTTFYLDTFTGEVLSRRSDVWRFYDFFWRLHVMDWKTGNDFNNPYVIAFSALTLPLVISGFVLLWIRLAKDVRTVRANMRAKRQK